jgi:cation transport protein ChaC
MPFRLSDAHIRSVHRVIVDPGNTPGGSYFTEELYDEHLREFLKGRPDGPVGVFASGSLIWKPVFVPDRALRARAPEWQRAFTLRIRRFRGTPEVPGLMMQVDRGAGCDGMLQFIAPGQEWPVLSDLWRREMTAYPPNNVPRWIEVEADGGRMHAIAFTANREGQNYVPGLTPDEVAACLAEACGHWGSGAEYLLQTVLALEAAGIHDPYLWDLQERVAERIELKFPALREATPSAVAATV